MANENKLQDIIGHCKEYGFVFQSSEIYDGLSAVYDYGQNGVELKRNIREYWWKSMTQMHENIVGIDAAIFMHPTTWKASGHVDNFSDPMIDNKDSKKRYRVDHLIEGFVEAILKEISNLREKVIDSRKGRIQEILPDGTTVRDVIYANGYRSPNDDPDYKKSINIEKRLNAIINAGLFDQGLEELDRFKDNFSRLEEKMNVFLASDNYRALKELIEEYDIKGSPSEGKNWTDVRQFNLMFSTEMGAVAAEEGEDNKVYLRPETAQGIFVNFLNVQKTGRMKIPFGIAQTGKAFRNEIVARGFIFRMREFEQMEMQFFVRPGTQKEWYEYWKDARIKWHYSLGIGQDKYRFHDHVKLAHYADAACDIEYDFPMGFKEVEGIHSRTDYDLTQHQTFSKKKMQYFDNDIDPETNKAYGNYIPYVVETSIGLDRTVMMLLSEAYELEDLSTEEKKDDRVVLKFPAFLAPTKLAILPLTKKDGLPEVAKALMKECMPHFRCFYEEKDAIGKRYRRMDAVGTPFCVTIDHQTLEDKTVTIRYRDTMLQERIAISEVRDLVAKACAMPL